MDKTSVIRYKKYYLYCYKKYLFEEKKNNLINKDAKVLRLTIN